MRIYNLPLQTSPMNFRQLEKKLFFMERAVPGSIIFQGFTKVRMLGLRIRLNANGAQGELKIII